MKPVKDIIKDKRLEYNMTMKELAEKVGVSEGTISRWESGEIANMRRGAIISLSKVLDIPPNILMGWEQDKDDSISPAIKQYQFHLKNTPDLSEAVELYTSLDDGDRGVIRGEMKGMLMHPKYTPILKELPARFDIAASGLDENTEAGKNNMDIIKKRIKELRRK